MFLVFTAYDALLCVHLTIEIVWSLQPLSYYNIFFIVYRLAAKTSVCALLCSVVLCLLVSSFSWYCCLFSTCLVILFPSCIDIFLAVLSLLFDCCYYSFRAKTKCISLTNHIDEVKIVENGREQKRNRDRETKRRQQLFNCIKCAPSTFSSFCSPSFHRLYVHLPYVCFAFFSGGFVCKCYGFTQFIDEKSPATRNDYISFFENNEQYLNKNQKAHDQSYLYFCYTYFLAQETYSSIFNMLSFRLNWNDSWVWEI